jgi:hypothetical protein
VVFAASPALLWEDRGWGLSLPLAGEGLGGGFASWLFPFSSTLRQITTTGYWRAANSTAAYGTATSAIPQGAMNSIIRLYVPGAGFYWMSTIGGQLAGGCY